MNKLAFLFTLLTFFYGLAQNKTQQIDKFYPGEIIDSTISKNLSLYPNYYPHYYSFDAKYPESSQTLLVKCRDYFKRKDVVLSGNGYITFNFMIDNEGKINFVKFNEVDEIYSATKFDRKIINTFYEYLKTLNSWKIATYGNEIKIPISYISYMSFKIENDKISNIIP